MAQYRSVVVGQGMEPVEATWRDVDYNLQVRAVCEGCNSGWMSRLEGEAGPFLQSMIRGNGRDLYERGQTLVATWACKTAMMFQARDDHDPIPERQRRELYDRRLPPDQVQVWLGAFSVWGIDFHRHVNVRVSSARQLPREGYGATFTAGHLVCQLFGHEAGYEVERRLSGPLAQAFVQVWPVGQVPVRWPPPARLGLTELNAVANSFQA